jgi:ABC-type multidrug transport system permease subunit
MRPRRRIQLTALRCRCSGWNVLAGCRAAAAVSAAAGCLIALLVRRFAANVQSELVFSFAWILVIPALLWTAIVLLLAGGAGDEGGLVDLLDEWALVVVPLCTAIGALALFTRRL